MSSTEGLTATSPPTLRKVSVADADRGTLLKYRADRGPVAYVLGMFVLHVALWCCATPLVAIASVVPLAVASMFIAPINHHHQHLNSFRPPWLNRFYDLTLALQSGVAPYSWVLHHNLGHHLDYLHQRPHERPDPSTWTRHDGTPMGRVEYTVRTLLCHQVDIWRVGLEHPRHLRYWLAMKLPLYTLIGVALFIDPLNTVLIFLLPGFIALTHTIWATYEHHAGCETRDHLVGSVNRDNRLYNLLTGNLGLHTAHHKRPGVHWSLLPQLHEDIKHQIPKELILTSFWERALVEDGGRRVGALRQGEGPHPRQHSEPPVRARMNQACARPRNRSPSPEGLPTKALRPMKVSCEEVR